MTPLLLALALVVPVPLPVTVEAESMDRSPRGRIVSIPGGVEMRSWTGGIYDRRNLPQVPLVVTVRVRSTDPGPCAFTADLSLLADNGTVGRWQVPTTWTDLRVRFTPGSSITQFIVRYPNFNPDCPDRVLQVDRLTFERA